MKNKLIKRLEKNGLSEALTWGDLAVEYNKHNTGRKAETLPINTVFTWAEKQTDKYKLSKEGTVHKIIN